jgi:hypothetical protein
MILNTVPQNMNTPGMQLDPNVRWLELNNGSVIVFVFFYEDAFSGDQREPGI